MASRTKDRIILMSAVVDLKCGLAFFHSQTRLSDSIPATVRYGFLGRPIFNHLQSITFSLQGQTKFRHIECVMVQKQSNREFFEQHLDSHSEAFIICCLRIFLMFFGSIYRLLVSKSAAMNLSFLFRQPCRTRLSVAM